MAEIEWDTLPERPSLRRAIRHQLHRIDPSLRVVAEAFLAAESPIDLLAVGGEGELVSVRIGYAGEDAALLTRALSDLAWLRPRVADLSGLAPELGIEATADARALLVCPDFGAETLGAIGGLPVGVRIEPIGYRSYRHHGQQSVVLEIRESRRCGRSPGTLGAEADSNPRDRGGRFDPAPLESESLAAAGPSTTGFRTGLSDADLQLEVEERKVLDPLPSS
jgi:hypothetical protein